MVIYLRKDGRFNNTSVWVLGERRLVTLMGCVQSPEQARAMAPTVLRVDDVLGAENDLSVGTAGKPRDGGVVPAAPPTAR